jgi:hypothetical protein
MHPRTAAARLLSLVALAICVAVASAACDAGRSSPRPSASLLDVEFTPQPATTPESTDEPSAEPTFISLPVGWDNAFCAVFADAVDGQQLVIDVERAIGEENFRDARGLARDLREVSADGTTLLADVPEWDQGKPALDSITELIALHVQAGDAYGSALGNNPPRNALRDARRLRRQIGTKTPAVNDALADLAALGIACEGYDLQLEEF